MDLDKDTIEEMGKIYYPIIKAILENDKEFFRFTSQIKIRFNYDESSMGVLATCSRTEDVIQVNLCEFMNYYQSKDFYNIEYYLLHEIRHIFQHLIIRDYKDKKSVPISAETVEKWIYEQEHYIRAIDKNGKENSGYFNQDSEFDAYLFSYAVMKYKYGDLPDLYVPSCYGREFNEGVDKWIDAFKKEGLSK